MRNFEEFSCTHAVMHSLTMYLRVKKIITQLIPKETLIKNEIYLRKAYSLFYMGNKLECNICNSKLRKFILLDNGNLLCPDCGSSARDRRLWEVLNPEFLTQNISVLDFSPSRCLYRKLKKQSDAGRKFSYQSTDISGDFIADLSLDITDTRLPDESYNLVICFHVLEHIEDDLKAMKELYRIMKKNGYGIIQTPFKEGETYEDFSKATPEERLKHFGQQDHVRIYSLAGLKSRLEKTGFEVEVRKYSEEPGNYFGFKEEDVVLVVKK
jgi:ubiquinone/menaquinone biosynthesis C-methylase UbiE